MVFSVLVDMLPYCGEELDDDEEERDMCENISAVFCGGEVDKDRVAYCIEGTLGYALWTSVLYSVEEVTVVEASLFNFSYGSDEVDDFRLCSMWL